MSFKITPEAKTLFDALTQQGVFAEMEHWDGHKHVDIFVPSAKLYIEVDGLTHFLRPQQIASDFMRDHYSDDDGFHTFRIPNAVVKENLQGVVKAICTVIKKLHCEIQ
jgi:very-short-patch-repair endonuclease